MDNSEDKSDHERLVNVESRVNNLEGELEPIFDGIADRLESLEADRKKAKRKPVKVTSIEDPALHDALYAALGAFQDSVNDHQDYLDNEAILVFQSKMKEQGYRILPENSLFDLADYYTPGSGMTVDKQPVQREDRLIRFDMACGHSGVCRESTTSGLGSETICWVCAKEDGGPERPFQYPRRIIVAITLAKDER